MKKFYLFLGLCCLTVSSGYAVQSSQSAPRVGTVRAGKISNTTQKTKALVPAKSVNTPVLSAITSQKTSTLGSLEKEARVADDSRVTFSSKGGLKNISHSYYIPTTEASKNSKEISELQKTIADLQAQLESVQNALDAKANIADVEQKTDAIDTKLEQIEQKTDSLDSDTITNAVRDALAAEDVLKSSALTNIEIAISDAKQAAKNEAIAAAAEDTARKLSEYPKINDLSTIIAQDLRDNYAEDSAYQQISAIMAAKGFLTSNNMAKYIQKDELSNNEVIQRILAQISETNEAIDHTNTMVTGNAERFSQYAELGDLTTINERIRTIEGSIDAEIAARQTADQKLVRSIKDTSNTVEQNTTDIAENKARFAQYVPVEGLETNQTVSGILSRLSQAEIGITSNSDRFDDYIKTADLGSNNIITNLSNDIADAKENIRTNTSSIASYADAFNTYKQDNDTITTRLTNRIDTADTQIATNRARIALNTSKFDEYTTTAALNTKLENLNGYVKTADLDNRFANYATQNDLADYVKTSTMRGILDLTSDDNLDGALGRKLSGYATISALNNYPKTADLKSVFGGDATVTLATAVNDKLNHYADKATVDTIQTNLTDTSNKVDTVINTLQRSNSFDNFQAGVASATAPVPTPGDNQN